MVRVIAALAAMKGSELQWVHGRRTVVRGSGHTGLSTAGRRFNGSTVGEPWLGPWRATRREHHCPSFNGSTVGEPWLGWQAPLGCSSVWTGFNGSTVGEPWLGWRSSPIWSRLFVLQWVHGRRTVVRLPRSIHSFTSTAGFNGSTVGEPWLGRSPFEGDLHRNRLQWVHGRRTVVRRGAAGETPGYGRGFNGSTVGEPWLGKSFKGSIAESGMASMGPRSENRG